MNAARLEALVVTVPRVIVGLAIFVSIGLNFANIVGRYAFNAPIIWAEEVMIFLMVWSVFIGAVLVTWEGRHIKMDLISAVLPSPLREIVHFVAALTFVAVCAFVVVQSWTVTSMMIRLEHRSVAAELPMAIPHLALLLGFAGMLAAVVVRFRPYATNAFGSEKEAATKQLKDSFGLFEAGEDPETPKPRASE
jgi:TRAP-type C4-dicarboxylate transport system permease small subunit